MDPTKQARDAAVAEALAKVRAIEAEDGVTRRALARIEAVMLDLAARDELFPEAVFEPNAEGSRLYELSVDPDRRFALYMDVSRPPKDTPPHDHTTWAVIACVRGGELNRLWRRLDAGGRDGQGTVTLDREVMVEPGRGIGLMPDDIHSIHIRGSHPTMNLHLYGVAFDRMTDRVMYDRKAGTVTPFPQRSETVPI